MANVPTPSSRASLLAGLRTGGVRSASQPHQVPHTAAPGGSFNAPRFASASHPPNAFPEEDEEDEQIADMASHNLNLNSHLYNMQAVPVTASAVDAGGSKFQQQQHQQLLLRQIAAQRAALGSNPFGDQAEMQAQMMQMEVLKYQALQQAQQAQQYQAELIAQAQRQSQLQSPRGNLRRPNLEPMTAGPTTSFDLRSAAAAQLRARVQQAEHRNALSAADDVNQMPMSAAIGGKFATRTLNPNANSFVANRFSEHDDDTNAYTSNNFAVPPTPSRTTVISGGTSLGTPVTSAFNAPSKSDKAISWRRGSSATNNSVLRSASTTPPLNIKVNRPSPPSDESSPPGKARPQPLQLSSTVSSSFPAVAFDATNVDEYASSGSSKGDSPTSTSTPSTPPSAHLSLASESKKPYEGIGVGRPAANGGINGTNIRQTSMPSRQPRGPPSGADELGPRNFATRLRRKAIGGLDALVSAGERRDIGIEIQAY